MKRISILLVAAMVLSTVVATANPFSDVPFSHWAYDAVNKLSAKGIIQGYPDGTFKGNKAVTRYALAMVTAKMVANIEQMLESGIGSNLVTKSDLQTLEKLTVEFADELALLGVKVTALEDDMQVVKEDVSMLKGDVDGIKDYMAKGGMEKVKISGDMLVRHQNMTYNVGAGATRPNPTDDGVDTSSQIRLTFKANIDENITAVARWYMLARNNEWNSPVTATTDNTIDLAYLQISDMFRFGGDFTFGRNFYSNGHALLLNDYVDAIRYTKRSGDMDVSFQYIYDRYTNLAGVNEDFAGIWNLNLSGKYRDHDYYMGFYMQHDNQSMYTAVVGSEADRFDIELGSKGPLGNNGHWDYDLGFVYSSNEYTAPATPDLKNEGFMGHAAVKWDSKKEWAGKLAYTFADDEFMGAYSIDNDQRYQDGIETPFEDISRGNVWFNNGITNLNIIKVQAEYRPRNNSKHYFRLAGDFVSSMDDDKANSLMSMATFANADADAMVATFEYRYQLAENTRVRVGYTNFDFTGDLNNINEAGLGFNGDNNYQMFWAEVYSQF